MQIRPFSRLNARELTGPS